MLLLSVLFSIAFSQSAFVQLLSDPGNGAIPESISKHFSDKFSCFKDTNNIYQAFNQKFYPTETNNKWYCCGYMANGIRQCDKMNKWRRIGDGNFALCDTSVANAVRTENGGVPELRRDLCCANNEFTDCGLCKSFAVWDFTVDGQNSHGGDVILEKELASTTDQTVTMSKTWREDYLAAESAPNVVDGVELPPYAYGNPIKPAGFMKATLREFNDPPVCVYAPNVAGRVIELKVEPEESGSNVCVDDLNEDSLERNEPGMTQACDDSRLRTCFPDAALSESQDRKGFPFLISCSESCADGDVDLWYRVRASINKWTESGDASKGTTDTEVNTEMWCMWGIGDMRLKNETDGSMIPFDFPENFDPELKQYLDGDFKKWDIYPSDLTPDEPPVVRPITDGVQIVSIFAALLATLVFF